MNVWAYTRFFGVNIYETGSIQSSAIKSGTVTYDASTATLTLDNVVAEDTNMGISLDFPSFTIKLIGNNVLRSLNSEGIYIQVASNVLITSDCGGSLSLEASQDEAIKYGTDEEGTMTIKDCSVSVVENMVSMVIEMAPAQNLSISSLTTLLLKLLVL